MTIAEKIAAKHAAAAAAKPTVKESLTVAIDQEAEAAIQRITQPGKHRGLVITPQTAQPTRPDVSQPVEVLWEPEYRTLGSTLGEGVPMVPLEPTTSELMWHNIANTMASELCIMSDPLDPETAWLAIRSSIHHKYPLMIYRLPYYEHPNHNLLRNQPNPF